MKIQILSDTHFEFNEYYDDVQIGDCDLLLLAGDINVGKRGIQWAKSLPIESIYVAGNHEFYGHVYEDLINDLKMESYNSNSHFLENDVYYFDDVRILGCTLWTSFLTQDQSYIDDDIMRYKYQSYNMDRYGLSLNDFYKIMTNRGTTLSAQDMLSIHNQSVEWLSDMLRTPYEGKTIVVTHHPPTFKCVNPNYIGSNLNLMFHNNYNNLIRGTKPDLWVFGHHHYDYDDYIGDTRLVSNQRGYVSQYGDSIIQQEKEFGKKVIEL